ncbi:PspA/IM30 family protein [Corynebacterium sp. Marseille-P3884]|uniref:PspA/IM30 family protein n=1 Tax=Corynebacterium sp. Marseille-P3884 TaxID=2495409 RepID=UPI001B324578|nr:PspA/IM30 family protein [Corynebacterium sp. Marseille-P3884]MBP3949470.1 PspA/IM30 family protein [Corynebacterium sp. Marseille-P3884]
MANPFSKGWKYLMQSFDSKIDENADPKVQIEQAAAAAKDQHNAITRQAAEIIGSKKQLEMAISRKREKQEELQDKTRTALKMADQATAEGDTTKASQFNTTAETLAAQLVTVEQELQDLSTQYSAAEQAAAQAEQQQKQSEARLQEQMNEVNRLRSQVDQAKMQEHTAQTMDTIGQFREDDSVPTLDGVRDKIERRYATALGQQELAESGVDGVMAEIESGQTDVAASSKLAEIRASMDEEKAGELTAGSAANSTAADESADQESAKEDGEPSEESLDRFDGESPQS